MDSIFPITRTKLITPRRRPELITRQRLLSVLEESQEYRLSIVAAPAGYGKTSLLVDFVNQSKLPVCWLSLDGLDQDPQRMISHFIFAVQQVFPEFGKTSLAALAGMPQDHLNLDTLVSLIVNEAFETISEHFIIVLDDYHLIEDSAEINYFINRLLMAVDENCHLIISSRRLLPLADMTLLVARGQVGGLGYEELAFQPDEIKSLYLQNHHVSLSDREAVDLAQSTEGWITGLILSTQLSDGKIIRQNHPNSVAGVSLYDYLAKQVLANLPEDIQIFLYRTSLLGEYNAEICEKVIGKALNQTCEWVKLMQRAQRSNLFVLPVIEDKIWLRYHHLFGDFLKHQMFLIYPEEAQKIEQRLAEYFAEIGEWEQAYEVYKRNGSREGILHLIENAGAAMISRGRLQTLRTWLAEIPLASLKKSARLISLQGATLVMLGEAKDGIKLLTTCIEMLQRGEDLYTLAHTYVRRSGAYRLTGDTKKALADAELAIEISEGEQSLKSVLAGAYYSKGTSLHLSGKLFQAQEWLTMARETFAEVGDSESAAKAAMEIGLVSRRLGQFQTAKDIYRQVLIYYESTGNIVWQANLLNNLGVLHHLSGDYQNALIEFERSINYAKMGGYQRLEGYALVSLGDLFRDIKALKEAGEAYNRAESILARINDPLLELFLNLSQSELDVYRGRVGRVKNELKIAEKIAAEIGSPFEINLCKLNRAKLAFIQKSPAEAIGDLTSALEFFTTEGYQLEALKSQLWFGLACFAIGNEKEGNAKLSELIIQLRNEKMPSLLVFTEQACEIAREHLQENAQSSELPIELDELSQYIKDFEKQLPSQRKLLRRQSQIVVLSAPELSVTTFGKIQVKIGEHIVSGMEWQSQNARDLLLILMSQEGGKTKEEIGAILWPESSQDELRLRFKNTIYRLRRAVGKDVILFDGERYSFNRDMDYEADFESFAREIAAAEKSERGSDQIDHYRQAVKMYNGPFLAELSENWVLISREYYHQLFQIGNIKLASLHLELGDFPGVVSVASNYLVNDRCNEEMVRIMMRAHAAMGNQSEVIHQYESFATTLKEELGSLPSQETIELYRTLVKRPRKLWQTFKAHKI